MSFWSDIKEELLGDFERVKSGAWISLTPEGESAKAAVKSAASTVKEVARNAAGSALAAMSTVNYSGSTGDFTSAYEIISLYARFIPVTGTNPDDFGSPLMQRRQLNTLSGFILCDHPHFSLTMGTITEADLIGEYMEKGFFLE